MISKIKNIAEKIICTIYRRTIPHKVKELRKKNKIRVLFIVSEASKWKTEYLYLAMRKHERFDPILGITLKTDNKPSESAKSLLHLITYLKSKNYDFIELIREDYIKTYLKPDIIIYSEPYSSTILRGYNYLHNLNCLFVSITYGFHSVLLPFNHFGGIKEVAWFDCYENDSTAEDAKKYTKGKRKNILTTGLPMSEIFLKYNPAIKPWKNNDNRKKIIWAPHHSIGFEYETITYGNFLKIAESMRLLSEKYKDKIYWAFKPHPLLKYKLELIWGAEKTNEYYSYWQNSDHSQLEEGEYVDLFMQSDAMIHDCDTFTIEYLYANKPVIYYFNNANHNDNLNSFAKQAISVHYKGTQISDIESFILNIIHEHDTLANERDWFYNNYLRIPQGINASENIINTILYNKV